MNVLLTKTGFLLDAALDYGYAFDNRIANKKPYDLFKVEGWFRLTDDTLRNKHLSVYGHGNLFFKDITKEEASNKYAVGIFQTYDFFNGGLIEIGDMGSSAGILSKIELGNKFTLNSTILAGPIVLGGSNSEVADPNLYTDDDRNYRDYIMGPGVQSKVEVELVSKKFGALKLEHHFWNIFVTSGPSDVEHLHRFNIDFELPVYNPFYLGSRYIIYNRDAKYDDFDDIHKRINELRIFAKYQF